MLSSKQKDKMDLVFGTDKKIVVNKNDYKNKVDNKKKKAATKKIMIEQFPKQNNNSIYSFAKNIDYTCDQQI